RSTVSKVGAGRRSIGPDDNSRIGSVTRIHDGNHRNGLLLRDQVIENEPGPPLLNPTALVFTRAMLEIKHRVTSASILVVARRSVHIGFTPFARDFGRITLR